MKRPIVYIIETEESMLFDKYRVHIRYQKDNKKSENYWFYEGEGIDIYYRADGKVEDILPYFNESIFATVTFLKIEKDRVLLKLKYNGMEQQGWFPVDTFVNITAQVNLNIEFN